MTTKELKYTYIEETMSILDNEELMKAALAAVKKVKAQFYKKQAKAEEMQKGIPALQYSLEELNNILDRAEADQAAGRYTTSEDVFHELKNQHPFLCK